MRRRTAGRNATADRAFELLFLFDERHPVRSALEFSDLLEMPRSTTYRYLQTLRSYGLVEEDEGRGYRLGPRILQLARIARVGLGLPEVALPIMRDVAAKVGEAVLLTRRSNASVVCIERVESSQPIRLTYERGHVLPVHAGSAAKILLAFSTPEEIDAVLKTAKLPRFTSHTVTDTKTLRRQLDEIRERGWTVSDGEVDEGVRGISAPVFHPDGRIAAGLSVAGPAFRIDDARLPVIVKAVRAGADAISKRLAQLNA